MRVADTASVASRIELAFQSASTSTGTSFDYLVKTAARESAFDPTAKARTSSATGLFQFIESTWLETLKEAGPKHGLEKYADQISRGKNGKHYVSDPQMRKEILDLRKDPEISSVMAGRAYPEERGSLATQDRAGADRWRTLHGPFPWSAWGKQADRRHGGQSGHAGGQDVFPPGAGQQADFLSQQRQRPGRWKRSIRPSSPNMTRSARSRLPGARLVVRTDRSGGGSRREADECGAADRS